MGHLKSNKQFYGKDVLNNSIVFTFQCRFRQQNIGAFSKKVLYHQLGVLFSFSGLKSITKSCTNNREQIDFHTSLISCSFNCTQQRINFRAKRRQRRRRRWRVRLLKKPTSGDHFQNKNATYFRSNFLFSLTWKIMLVVYEYF